MMDRFYFYPQSLSFKSATLGGLLLLGCSSTPGDADSNCEGERCSVASGGGGGGGGSGGLSAGGGATGAGGNAATADGGDSSAGGSVLTSGGVEGTGGNAVVGSGGTAEGSGGDSGVGGTSDGSGGDPSSAGGATASGGSESSAGGTSASGGAVNIDVNFIIGADISGVEEKVGTTYVDTDGGTKAIFEILKNHGFNYIRLRTFVDPSAPYGYSSQANGCDGKSESYGDQAHVIAQGKKVKAAEMGFLLDFHYSDVWADPGNQIVPDAWRSITTIQGLADQVKSYTKQYIEAAVLAGARPDMVQIGNEISPGMLMHQPSGNTDCWGNNPTAHTPSGSTQNWDNLALLLKAGIAGVREVDPSIQIMLHTENTADVAAVRWWVDNASDRGVDFDILGLSAYTAFQGPPATWRNTFETIASEHPELSFVIAEYNPERTAANQIMLDLPNGRGRGTFFWEPTEGGEWGDAMFSWQGNSLVANSKDFAEFDQIRSLAGLN